MMYCMCVAIPWRVAILLLLNEPPHAYALPPIYPNTPLSQPFLIQLGLGQSSGLLPPVTLGDATVILPEGVVTVLKSKACRTAVMFGDEIGRQAGREMIR